MIPTEVRVGFFAFSKVQKQVLVIRTELLAFKINSLMNVQNNVRTQDPKTVLCTVICQEMRTGIWDDLCVLIFYKWFTLYLL